MTARLQRLRAEIASDRAAFAARASELAGLRLVPAAEAAGDLARAALAFHHAYGAVESLLMRVARTLEGSEPEGADWHQALLADMALDIEGVRPAVLSPASVSGLRRLLAFRHFLRHAYAVALDAGSLAGLRDDVLVLRAHLDADLDRLDRFLLDLAMQAAD